jgi:hypothetical protein
MDMRRPEGFMKDLRDILASVVMLSLLSVSALAQDSQKKGEQKPPPPPPKQEKVVEKPPKNEPPPRNTGGNSNRGRDERRGKP